MVFTRDQPVGYELCCRQANDSSGRQRARSERTNTIRLLNAGVISRRESLFPHSSAAESYKEILHDSSIVYGDFVGCVGASCRANAATESPGPGQYQSRRQA